ncbi:TlpA disulfide reductase family protein [uncultured Kriegella sp.]|uniref:TlpA disulfide reductase family protein n=1 Tax=uncultured Kriegella sp. TaxID=1798910 RepID=UPI0030D9C7DC|tara:strand:- start:87572 stop:88702 length:1131 start_codon:yes stop_codon:yes gene_type:complete
MKKVFISFCALIAIVSCSDKKDGFTIAGTLTGDLENDTKVFLRKMGEERQLVDVDTALVQNGKFTFTGEAGAPELQYVFVDKLPGNMVVIIEDGEIQLSAQKDSLGLAKLEGTPQNELFSDYMEESLAISQRAQSVQGDLQSAAMKKDTVLINSLRDEMMELQEEYKNFELDYIKDNPTGLISVLLIDRAMASRMVATEKIQELYDGLSPEIKETTIAKDIFKNLEALKAKDENAKNTAVGAKAPNFSAPTPSGEELALNDALGKITLVDFWAAWCKPCRAENPNIVKVYKKYHEKGLNIIGVSLDKKAEDWKKAIEDDGLTWNHVSNIAYFDDAIAKLYNVDAIPAAFLLDENGVIVAKNLRGPALEQKVAELLQ